MRTIIIFDDSGKNSGPAVIGNNIIYIHTKFELWQQMRHNTQNQKRY